jgi:hypothetical protein
VVEITHLFGAGLLPKWGVVKRPSLWQCGWAKHISQACGGGAGVFPSRAFVCWVCEGLARTMMTQLTGGLHTETLPSKMQFNLCNFPWPMLRETQKWLIGQ